jgi:hypothetical protein
MMIDFTKDLAEEEKKLIKDSPVYVSILIAGADGTIDDTEIKNAIQLSKENVKKTETFLISLYEELEHQFQENLERHLQEIPDNLEERNKILTEKLSRLNPLLSKTDKTFSIVYYAFLKEVARRVAKASGGFMGINAISREEEEFLDLPMINDPSIIFKGS